MNKKRSFKVLGMLLASTIVFSSLLIGCSGNKSVSTDAKGTVNITYWSHNNLAFVNANKKQIADFQKENPNVKFNYQNFPYDVTATKLKVAFAAHNEPDIVQAFGAWLPPYLNQNLLAPVPDEMASTLTNNYYEGATTGYMKNGKYYGVPIEINVEYGLFYVPEKVSAAGIVGAPKTWADVLSVAKASAVFQNGSQQYGGLEFYNNDNLTFLFLSWIKQLGGDYWSSDKKHLNFDTPQAQQAWQTLVNLVTVDKVTDTKHVNTTITTENYFFSKKAAEIVKGSWAASVGDEEKDDDWAFTFLPPLAGDKPYFVVEPGWGMSVSARSKNISTCWDFVKSATSGSSNKDWNVATNTISPIKADAQDPSYLNAGNNPKFKDQFTNLQYATAIGPAQDTDFLKVTIYNTFASCVSGQRTTSDSLKYIQTQVNLHIDQILAQ